ncbi:MAG: Rubrerythrin [Promethearchaeota archaeon]|nr:MAG: Rubrerythrin [Candidatus Lokiarchaeota archaeon]
MTVYIKVFVCEICGEAYIGEETPDRCPFCGAPQENLVDAKDYDDSDAWALELNETDKANVEKALEVEISNDVFYKCASKKTPEVEGQKMFKILSKVEGEHASVWKKILDLDKIDKWKEKCATNFIKNLEDSHSREERAINFYRKAAEEATHPRVKRIFEAFVEVETDHLKLSEERLK